VERVFNSDTTTVGGTESAFAIGRIAFKTTEDIAWGYEVCTGLCLISRTCGTVVLGCSTIKITLFWNKIYISAKSISKRCIAFKNACAGEEC
jgi:hypothetical protein